MRKDLPPRYYLTHFHEFLAFFEGASQSLLSSEAVRFIQRFKALDEDKQCIVVRAANRKYAVIDRMQFNYGEIVAVIPFLLNRSPNGKAKIAACVGAFWVICRLIPY